MTQEQDQARRNTGLFEQIREELDSRRQELRRLAKQRDRLKTCAKYIQYYLINYHSIRFLSSDITSLLNSLLIIRNLAKDQKICQDKLLEKRSELNTAAKLERLMEVERVKLLQDKIADKLLEPIKAGNIEAAIFALYLTLMLQVQQAITMANHHRLLYRKAFRHLLLLNSKYVYMPQFNRGEADSALKGLS